MLYHRSQIVCVSGLGGHLRYVRMLLSCHCQLLFKQSTSQKKSKKMNKEYTTFMISFFKCKEVLVYSLLVNLICTMSEYFFNCQNVK